MALAIDAARAREELELTDADERAIDAEWTAFAKEATQSK